MSNTQQVLASSSGRAKRSRFTQLTRTPWIPERMLQEYGGICDIDSRFRRAARMLQIFWMRDHGIPNATADDLGSTHLASHLSAEAGEAGLNFLSADLHLLALREMLLREEMSAWDEDRLACNALSSQPLVFNALGPLALDLKLASKVFRQLLPDFVKSVDKIIFEHSPGRRDIRYLADRTAWDAAIHVKTPEGESGIVYLEMKYSEDMSGPAARWRDRYDEVLHEVRLFKDPNSPILRSVPIEQLVREHALAQKAVDNGVAARAVFIAIGPRLNRRVGAAFVVYANELLPTDENDRSRVQFRHFTLEAFIDAIDAAGDQAIADRLWQRYCNFQRLYDAAMSVLAPRLVTATPTTAMPGSLAGTGQQGEPTGIGVSSANNAGAGTDAGR